MCAATEGSGARPAGAGFDAILSVFAAMADDSAAEISASGAGGFWYRPTEQRDSDRRKSRPEAEVFSPGRQYGVQSYLPTRWEIQCTAIKMRLIIRRPRPLTSTPLPAKAAEGSFDDD